MTLLLFKPNCYLSLSVVIRIQFLTCVSNQIFFISTNNIDFFLDPVVYPHFNLYPPVDQIDSCELPCTISHKGLNDSSYHS